MSINMFSQRALQTTMRRFAATRPTSSPLRTITPAAVATGQIRYASAGPHASTVSASQNEAHSILAEQRKHRPVSPHLGIYKYQITWLGSITNRITGMILSGGLYVFGLAYLAAPAFGWHLESASLAAAFAAWPIVAKVLAKFVFAWPFTYHSINGIRHLVWDMGSTLTNKEVIYTGWAVVGISVVTALGLVFY
ncbi:cytochrome b subunit of succinate dehydrogenase, Sdh3p [Knufia obscura]|uniref:Cytochrome b subunit of succinate dehydrogenase, Sdh3p n=1 Tax=Knufia obscura TaxID=1635080 RepID=A0ABR0RCY0_9EURO|nr:cytochrome b subunit of succinate dehydrogenase, Sdh3p [Knufia obscura]